MSESGGDLIELQPLASAITAVAHELVLLAAIGFLIGGLDELAVDCIWIGRLIWRRATVYRTHARGDLSTLRPPLHPDRLALFVPAWHEAPVIGQMLDHALGRLDHDDYRIYVGCYPNDPETMAVVDGVMARDLRVRMVINTRPGPTTKADCLNALWAGLIADEDAEGRTAKAIILHDAEDVVHSGELRVFDRLIESHDLVQLPVLPLIDQKSRWIGGHYIDEFAESHGKAMIVREALGAAIPSAGVGCAISRRALGRIAEAKGGTPFDADSLTEDYEIGLGIAAQGGSGIFVSLPIMPGGKPLAIRAHFPGTLKGAVRQKSRWIVGIALSGWDRLGWRGGVAERWMRLRDRRAPLAAIILLAAYAGLLLTAFSIGLSALGFATAALLTPLMRWLLWTNLLLLCWRLIMRFGFVSL